MAPIITTHGAEHTPATPPRDLGPYQHKGTKMELLIIWALFAGFTSYIASQKNRSALAWLFWGLFFGIFAMVAVIAVPARDKQSVAG